MDKRSLAIGIVIGIAVIGCIAAVTAPTPTYQDPTPRFVNIIATGSLYAVLDTDTGTINEHECSGGVSWQTTVFPFLAH